MPAAIPFGAQPDDTGEYMLGDILVSVVLMESSTATSGVNDNSETWTSQAIAAVKNKVREGLDWWSDTLADITDRHQLNFQIDFTLADNPVETPYEPITRPSTDFRFWIDDFFREVGQQSGDFSADIRAFNHQQRVTHGTHWAFTIFVVNDENDADGQFASGGFSRAFAFAGGRFFVMPAGRPASTISHETGHMFWARDEYPGGGTYDAFRGYYDTQNRNAWNNPSPGFQQVPSIMDRGDCESGGGLLCDAYQMHTSSASSLEMMGWLDSDQDGVFDVLDVPLSLKGTGFYDESTGMYQFQGTAAVGTFPNQNSSGLQNDITINQVSRAEYRFDQGPWQNAETYDAYETSLDLTIPWEQGAESIEIRVVDATTGITSETFTATQQPPASVATSGISGFVWNDEDASGVWESDETPLAGWQVQLVQPDGSLAPTQEILEPDDYGAGALLNDVGEGVVLTAIGSGVADDTVSANRSTLASTGERVLASFSSSCGGFCNDWTSDSRNLRIDFTQPAYVLSLDAIGKNSGSRSRLEIYNVHGELMQRHTTGPLDNGMVETMTLASVDQAIAYAIAAGHNSTIQFDHLRIGTAPETSTDALGAYVFPHLDSGDYSVQVIASNGLEATSPNPPQQDVRVESLGSVTNVDFGFAAVESKWQNPTLTADVSGDGIVSPIDVLIIINDQNSLGSRKLATETTPPYLDVNGDGFATSQDALSVINVLNQVSGSGEGEAHETSPRFFVAAGTSPEETASNAEGEGVPLLGKSRQAAHWAPETRQFQVNDVSRPATLVDHLENDLIDLLAEDQNRMAVRHG